MRCFLAVGLPEEHKRQLAAGLERLKRELPSARWVRADGLHITLKFLGEVAESSMTTLLPSLSELLAPLPAPLAVQLGGGGFFPHPQRARVAWLGGQAPGLERWAQAAELAAEQVGVRPEGRPFSLHVTLARLERPWPPAACQRFLRELSRWSLPPFQAQEVVLYESQLSPQGARYTERWRVAVGGR